MEQTFVREFSSTGWFDPLADPLAWFDETLSSSAYEESLSDSSGTTDSVDVLLSHEIEVSDDAGSTDSSTSVKGVDMFVQDSVGQSYSSVVLADAPVIYLKLDETSGTTAADSSGNGNNGTIPPSNVSYSQAPMVAGLNNSLLFSSGVSQSINIPYTGYLNNTSFTLELWMNPDNWSTGNPVGIWDLMTGGNQECILVRKGDSGAGDNYQIGVSAGGFAAGSSVYDPGSPTNGTPKHIVVTYDASNGDMILYLDGTPRGTAVKSTGGYNFGTSGTLAAMANGGTNQRLSTGYVSNVAVYADVLAPSRISAHYSAGVSLGLTDYIVPGTDHDFYDDVTTSDSATISLDRSVSFSDDAVATDSAEVGKEVQVSELTGTTDNYTITGDRTLDIQDSAYPSDTMATSGILTATLEDLPGVTDSATIVKTSPNTFVGWGMPLR